MLWDQALETGIEEIDDRNRELFSLIDDLMNAEAAAESGKMLSRLGENMRRNFAEEEGLHEMSGYPLAEPHRRAHNGFIVALLRAERRMMAEGPTLENLLAFNCSVVDGLRRHVLTGDMEFADYRGQTSKARPFWPA